MIYPRRETETNNKCGLDATTIMLLSTAFIGIVLLIYVLYLVY
jgi:hypothetical protein